VWLQQAPHRLASSPAATLEKSTPDEARRHGSLLLLLRLLHTLLLAQPPLLVLLHQVLQRRMSWLLRRDKGPDGWSTASAGVSGSAMVRARLGTR